MIDFSQPVTDLIRQRFSCRTYQKTPLSPEARKILEEFSTASQQGRQGSRIRFLLAAAAENDDRQLRGLGTYGFIQDPAGFILGAVQSDSHCLEDFGYQTELIILKATELGIGSCWLGGTFTKSRFARLMDLQAGEFIPAVISLGYPADQQAWLDRVSRIYAGADRRLEWEQLFFDGTFQQPLGQQAASAYALPLEMVRLAPSASNKQPWRILRQGNAWHFYIQRTRRYPPPFFDFLLDLADLQRIDLGIAMAHFELSAREAGLGGIWQHQEPDLPLPDERTEYNISWIAG